MGNRTEKCKCIFLGSRTVSLSRSSGETLAVHSTESIFCKKMRGEKTALKSCSSLLALLSFPKLLPPLRFPQRLSFHYNHKKFLYGKCECIFLGSRTMSLSRSSGETLAVHSTESIFYKKDARRENRFEKLFFSPRAPLFPQTSAAFAISAKAIFSYI